jgi:hypothetical protein
VLALQGKDKQDMANVRPERIRTPRTSDLAAASAVFPLPAFLDAAFTFRGHKTTIDNARRRPMTAPPVRRLPTIVRQSRCQDSKTG